MLALTAAWGVLAFSHAIVPNKLVSGGLPAYTGTGSTDYLTDGFLTNWKSSSSTGNLTAIALGLSILRPVAGIAASPFQISKF